MLQPSRHRLQKASLLSFSLENTSGPEELIIKPTTISVNICMERKQRQKEKPNNLDKCIRRLLARRPAVHLLHFYAAWFASTHADKTSTSAARSVFLHLSSIIVLEKLWTIHGTRGDITRRQIAAPEELPKWFIVCVFNCYKNYILYYMDCYMRVGAGAKCPSPRGNCKTWNSEIIQRL